MSKLFPTQEIGSLKKPADMLKKVKDPNVSDDILDLLEIATRNGTSVLMSTHNFPLVKPRKKPFIELNNGRIVK